jgi:hypothetical protein
MSPNGKTSGQLIFGIMLIALGVLFLLDRLFSFHFGHYLGIWWPVVLIVLGVWKMAENPHRRMTGPLVLITLGAIFLVDNLEVFWWWDMGNLWPLILIAVGAGMMMGRLRAREPQPPVEPPTIEVKS